MSKAKRSRRQASRARQAQPRTRTLHFEVAEERRLLAALTIAQENALPGVSADVWDVGFGSANIEGFATEMSVDQGQTIEFKIETDADDYRIDIYRTGYYGGLGARYITTIDPDASLANDQPDPVEDASTGLIDAGNWQVSAQWDVPDDATSGVYLANLIREDGTFGESQIVFVVRDDDGQSDIVYKTSDSTWQAYNNWGGRSLYEGDGINGSGDGRAYAVSYNRPMNYDIRSFNLVSFYFGTELPMVMFMERNGYDVSYVASTDLNSRGSLLLDHEIFVTSGHDEYWSAAERSAAETARDAGVSLGFFGGNDVFWKTYWEPSIFDTGTPDRTLVSYKSTHANDQIDTVNPDIWTGTWRDPRFSPPADGFLPENALIGTQFMVNSDGSSHAISVPGSLADLRFWRNTSVANLSTNQTATLTDNVIGPEWNEDVDNGFRPAGLIHLSRTNLTTQTYLQDFGSTYAPGSSTHTLTMYRAESGALVFSAGSQQFVFGLEEFHDGIVPEADPDLQQAIVNLFADMGAQPTTLMPGLVAAVMSTDLIAPVSTITSPSGGINLQSGVPITISGTAQDGGGGTVAAIEVSVDGGLTWRAASGLDNWSYSWTPRSDGQVTIVSRAVDDSGNIESDNSGVTVNPQTTNTFSLWNNSEAPSFVDSGDGQAVELGVRFMSDVDGFISGLRFYKSAANTGTHTANLWTADGQLIATATFTNETGSGWQQVDFAAPVAITAGTIYVASYHTPSGHYSLDGGYFSTWGIDNGPLHAMSEGPTGHNGVYLYGDGGFPINNFQANNYWVDVVLTVSDPTDTTAPLVTGITPLNGAIDISTNVTASITFNEAVNAATVNASTILLRDESGASVSATVGYNASTNTATLTPNSALDALTTYTLVVQGGAAGVTDLSGNALASNVTSSFITADSIGVVSNLWSRSETPAIIDSGDPSSVELGVEFIADTDGFVTGLWFYKAAGNSGTHTANLWSAGGQLLATATFANETASGWQHVDFANPVAVTAGTTYVASYHTNNGHYSVSRNYFDSAFSNGSLSVPAGGGLYQYGDGGFPTDSYQGSNYWIDVDLTTTPPADTTAPTVTAFNPAGGSLNVAIGVTPTITFSEALNSSTVNSGTVFLRDATGTVVPSSVAYNASTNTVTLNPSTALANSTTYTIVVGGGSGGVQDLAGNALASNATSSFTTLAAPDDDSTPPTVTGFSPAGGTSNVATGVRPTITFSEALDSSTVNTGTIFLRDALDAVVSSSVAYNVSTNTVTLTPGSGLANSTTYTIVVGGGSGGVQDLAGNALASNATSSFTTLAADTTAPTVTGFSPAGGTSNVAAGVRPTVTFSEALDSSTVNSGSIFLRDASGAVVSSSVAYNTSTNTVTLTPNSALATATTYTIVVTGGSGGVRDLAGNALASNATSSFTTTDSASLWLKNTTPAIIDSGDPSEIELGVEFTSNTDGFITGMWFYKAAGNNGTHTANLWTAGGQLLESATFANETSSGWQHVDFANPVAVSAGTTYVASYHTNNGHYSVSRNYFDSSFTNGPLTVSADGGLYAYGSGGFPSNTYQGSNYWIDVDLTTTPPVDTTAPTVTAFNPASGSSNVATGVAPRITFSEGLDSSTVNSGTVFLRDASGAVVSSSVAYNASTNTVTVSPDSNLANSTTYTVVVTGGSGGVKDLAGNALVATASSSFTTLELDTTAPTVTGFTPSGGASDVGIGARPTITFSEALDSSTVTSGTVFLRDASGGVVASSVAYNGSTNTVTLTPSNTLANATDYTIVVIGGSGGVKDLSGNALASTATSSFTTNDTANLWQRTTTPAIIDSGDPSEVELGVEFTANADGFITGMWFYKAAGNDGTHTANLWTSGGQLLATAEFSNETSSGWQHVEFSAPVAINAGTTYVASYHTTSGHYSVSRNYFDSAFTNGPLTVSAGGGVYAYGSGGFPTNSYQGSNYWVDVDFVSSGS